MICHWLKVRNVNEKKNLVKLLKQEKITFTLVIMIFYGWSPFLMNFICVEREPQTICYLTNWSHKRPRSGKFMPEDIDSTLCTHIIYAFATLKDHLLTEGNDKDVEMYERLVALREKNPEIKVS